MRAVFALVSILLFSANIDFAGTLRVGLKGKIQGQSTITVFDDEILVPLEEHREIFTGPYTLKLSPIPGSSGKYDMTVELSGLGPDFKYFQYPMTLAVGEKMIIPSLPVKNNASISYIISIRDDTSSVRKSGYPLDDASRWDISASIHYLTHWVKGSLADFTWNVKMGYLENIYDQYRASYKLSMFEKIDFYFHPEPTDEVYTDPDLHYAILPDSRRIDLIYGHDIDAATPAPAAELLIYHLWGYGPRWMVTGLAHYYDDGKLASRKFADQLEPVEILAGLSRHDWVDSDTGSIFCAGFVNWLLETHSFSSFKNLYRRSSPLDFEMNFREIYGMTLPSAIEEYLDHIRNYKPRAGELEYYASLYYGQNRIEKAREYYAELAAMDDDDMSDNLAYLASCHYWLGDYEAARKTYGHLVESSGRNPRFLTLEGDMEMALGDFDSAVRLYEEASGEGGYGISGLRLVTILIDEGDPDSARAIFEKLDGDILRSLDYYIESARLKIISGQADIDSLLEQTAARALNLTAQSAHDPINYLIAGRAFALLGQFNQAKQNLDIAFFLERRPYFQALVLLQQGRRADLQGRRDEAKSYYRRAADSGGGAYLKMLARKYIKSKYELAM
jgi:tetratricopeptide (TPR) repeat protein